MTSQIVMAGGGRSLRMEGLEQRALLAADVYVDDNWAGYSNGDAIADVDGNLGNGLQAGVFGWRFAVRFAPICLVVGLLSTFLIGALIF